VRPGSNRLRSASSTWRGAEAAGRTPASTPVNSIRVNGSPAAMSSAAVAIAIVAGRRMTRCDRRYQNPRSVATSRWRSRAGASASTRSPSTMSSAGSAVSATKPAMSAVIAPLIAIEYKKRCGKTSSASIAAATVAELKTTVRPAVCSVRPSASRPGPERAISSR